ncbi:DNA helicase [Spirochaetia bacterium]|nr:DNA helicase [Spirochaetia bacterium]
MRVRADLHIHSRFSRATSPRLTPAYLERWARIKGIELLGTGDCTHPLWLKELREQLVDGEPGLYTLKDAIGREFDNGPALAEGLPNPAGQADGGAASPRFVLTGEISTIYKKGDKTRKVHHLVILPDFKAAALFQTRLERIGGNISSDGRPILGVDSHDLLSMLLDTDDRALLIPAHIWTPWFSALGAKSGFDSIGECYGDLAGRIPAIETGLSSNPPMNWAVASLDRCSIISNSDAHSPDKLGREATIFDMDLSYASLHAALVNGSFANSDSAPNITETVEFFPQEGKYHYDGHRKCGVFLSPEAAIRSDGICPVCGRPLTRGVMGRVLELADRPVNETEPCPQERSGTNRRPYRSLIPLKEIIGELLETSPASKKADAAYGSLIEKGGSELSLLMDRSPAELEILRCPGISGELLAAAISAMRSGTVSITPGYDGEYGVIRVCGGGVRAGAEKESDLFGDMEGSAGETGSTPEKNGTIGTDSTIAADTAKHKMSDSTVRTNAAGTVSRGDGGITGRPAPPQTAPILNSEQEAAVAYDGDTAIIIAGPGTGKTGVIAARIARLIKQGSDPASILALSFTVKAAAELRERIARTVGDGAGITAATFHSLGVSLLREQPPHMGIPENFRVLGDSERDAILTEVSDSQADKKRISPRRLGNYIEERKRFLLLPGEAMPKTGDALSSYAISPEFLTEAFGLPPMDPELDAPYGQYREQLRAAALLDFDDLIAGTVRLLAGNKALLEQYRSRFRHILVDEYQDINFAQYVLIRLLAPSFPKLQRSSPELLRSSPELQRSSPELQRSSPELQRSSPELRVIGDPNQAIYGFRGSDKRFIDRFTEDYPQAQRFQLTKSFRCAAPIIGAAGQLADARYSRLEGTGGAVRLFRSPSPTEKSEAEGIARRIAALIGGTSFFALDSNAAGDDTDSAELRSLDECAILLRTNALAPPIIKALKDHGIPFDLTGDRPWWEEEPIKPVLDLLRECSGAGKPPAAFPTKFPEEAVRTAWDIYRKTLPASRKKTAASESSNETAALERLCAMASLYEELPAFLDILAVSGAGGGPDHISTPKREGIRIMTIHASKGLEFDHIFVPALEEGLLPFTLYGDAATERIEEERRLLYVAMTRARTGLYLSWAASRDFQGRELKAEPSRFLSMVETRIPLSQEERRRQRDPQLKLF